MPTCWIIAGPNGAGKTTFALEYLPLPSVEMSKLRVAERVAHGGHNIPVADIERRFPRSLNHLLYDFSHRVDSCTCFMSGGESPVLVFEKRGSDRDIVHNDDYQLASP